MTQDTTTPQTTTSAPTNTSKPAFTLRIFGTGDLGYIVHRHGVLYNQEYGFGPRFEAVAARIVADFADSYDPDKECCWIAERNDDTKAFLGCVMLVKDPEDLVEKKTAKLRLLLVEPQSRGLGIGATLIRQCTTFARQAGHERIVLWTQSILDPARRLYAREGYRLVKTEEHASFGFPMTGENWELVL